MVGGAWHSWLGFWREWLGRVHLNGIYPSLLHNRGFDACSTSSLRPNHSSRDTQSMRGCVRSSIEDIAPALNALSDTTSRYHGSTQPSVRF